MLNTLACVTAILPERKIESKMLNSALSVVLTSIPSVSLYTGYSSVGKLLHFCKISTFEVQKPD